MKLRYCCIVNFECMVHVVHLYEPFFIDLFGCGLLFVMIFYMGLAHIV